MLRDRKRKGGKGGHDTLLPFSPFQSTHAYACLWYVRSVCGEEGNGRGKGNSFLFRFLRPPILTKSQKDKRTGKERGSPLLPFPPPSPPPSPFIFFSFDYSLCWFPPPLPSPSSQKRESQKVAAGSFPSSRFLLRPLGRRRRPLFLAPPPSSAAASTIFSARKR